MKDPYQANYQYVIKKREKNCHENPKDPNSFTEYSNDMTVVCNNIEEYTTQADNLM